MKFVRWLDRLLLRATVYNKEVPIFCECNDADCIEALPISEETYLDNRARYPESAQVLNGHEDDVDNVLEIHRGYLIVQQIGK